MISKRIHLVSSISYFYILKKEKENLYKKKTRIKIVFWS